jgi:exonuclease SbcC
VRPLRLRVKGLRSFRAEREIDFADLGLVAVVGDTGAGKSSLLEAITYALYNATTWDQRGVKQLISDGATTMSVELEFAVDGRVYRIARSTSRGAYPPPAHELECLTDQAVPPLDSEDAINAEVARLVGLDWGGFTAAVILPQGRFQTLLQASPADRTEILKGIFRLGELAEAREHARELALGYREPLEELKEARALLLPDPAAAAREARRRRREAEQEERRFRGLKVQHTAQEKTAAREGREAQRLAATAEKVAEANVHPARDLRALAPQLRELEKLAAQLDAVAEEAQKQEARLAASLERAERAGEAEGELAGAKAVLERLVAEVLALAEERAELDEARREVSRDEAALARDERSLAELRREATRRERACAAAEKVASVVAELHRREHEREEADDALGRLERQLANAGTIAERKAELEEAAKRRLAAAAERLEPLLRAHAAAHAAHGLEPGEECPICHQELPRGFEPPRAPAVRAAQDAHDRAEAAARAAGEARAAAVATAGHLEQAVAGATRKRASARRALDRVRKRLGAVDPAAAEGALDEARRAATEGRRAAEKAEAALRPRRAAVEERKASFEVAAARLAERAAALERERAGLPRRFRPAASARVDRRASLLAALEARLDEVRRLRHEREATRNRLAELRKDRDELVRRREREVEQPRRRIEKAMLLLSQRVESEAPLPAEESTFKEQLAHAQRLERAADRLAARLAKAAEEASARSGAARAAAAAALLEAGVTDGGALDELVIEASAKRSRARDEEDEARAQVPAARDLDRKVRPVRESIEVLEAVASLLTDGRFIGYVVTRRQRALLAFASEILGSMTGARYGFAEDFRIVDRVFGQARGSKTLSGGEAFLASLALALGLVELAARGGGRLEALFLDEGFGSLDADALDDALGELERRAHAGRLVAVISHIRSVAERIEDVLQVSYEPEGSRVARVTGAARDAFVEEEVEERLLA